MAGSIGAIAEAVGKWYRGNRLAGDHDAGIADFLTAYGELPGGGAFWDVGNGGVVAGGD